MEFIHNTHFDSFSMHDTYIWGSIRAQMFQNVPIADFGIEEPMITTFRLIVDNIHSSLDESSS